MTRGEKDPVRNASIFSAGVPACWISWSRAVVSSLAIFW